MKKLENKVAVITGGNSGIGLATAILFADEGAKVAITGRNTEKLKKATESINQRAIAIKSDVSNFQEIRKTYEKVEKELGKIDVLVVNAGINRSLPLADFTEKDFDEISSINFKGVFFSVQLALPFLNDGASVILTSSGLKDKGYATQSIYSATKAAMFSLAKTFSAELAARNIRVNVMAPGAVDTAFLEVEEASEEENAKTKTYYESIIPAKRLGTVGEIAEGYLFLASDASKYMMGSALTMDGGFTTL